MTWRRGVPAGTPAHGGAPAGDGTPVGRRAAHGNEARTGNQARTGDQAPAGDTAPAGGGAASAPGMVEGGGTAPVGDRGVVSSQEAVQVGDGSPAERPGRVGGSARLSGGRLRTAIPALMPPSLGADILAAAVLIDASGSIVRVVPAVTSARDFRNDVKLLW